MAGVPRATLEELSLEHAWLHAGHVEQEPAVCYCFACFLPCLWEAGSLDGAAGEHGILPPAGQAIVGDGGSSYFMECWTDAF